MSKQKALGQFFTPEYIVEFIYDMILKMRPKNAPTPPRIIDPACGEGIFLKYAIENNISRPDLIFGIDKDEEVAEQWEKLGIKDKLNNNLYIQDGLYDTFDCRVSTKHNNRKFDIVVGNPPYGGVGIENLESDKNLYNAIRKYELIRRYDGSEDESQVGLLSDDYIKSIKKLSDKEIKKIEGFSIEILFLERFIQLARTGGLIGIIIPEGILANYKLQYVRDWLMSKCFIEGIVSLPRTTFKESGTTAKTAILFLRKLEKGEIVPDDTNIFMASIDEDEFKGDGSERDEMKKLVSVYDDSDNVSILNPTRTITDVKWGDIIGSRADPEYWYPEYRELVDDMSKNWEVRNFDYFISSISYGQVGERIYSKKGIRYITTKNFDTLFLDLSLREKFVKPGSHNDPERSRVRKGDLLLVGNGVACIGRSSVYMFDEEANIEQNIILIRTNNISNYFLDIFLKSKYGQLQIKRLSTSVGTVYINFPNVRKIKIPSINESLQYNIEKEYKKIHKSYLNLLDKNNDKEEIEEIVSDLVKRLEELIEGKRETF